MPFTRLFVLLLSLPAVSCLAIDTVSMRPGRLAVAFSDAGPLRIDSWDLNGRRTFQLQATLGSGSHSRSLSSFATVVIHRIRTPSGQAIVKSVPFGQVRIVLGHPPLTRMADIPGGRYVIGSPPEEPGHFDDELLHRVDIVDFQIDRSEVTRGLYAFCLGMSAPADSEAQLPVTDVSWFDAVLFANARSKKEGLDTAYSYSSRTEGRAAPQLGNLLWNRASRGYRLPTEAEWEVATRAGSSDPWNWGTSMIEAVSHAWFADNSDSRVHPVAQLAPNAWGIHDMAGNAWEWTWDWYGGYDTTSQATSERSTGQYRSFRGGSIDDSLLLLRSAFRSGAAPDYRATDLGFRCAKTRFR